MKSGETSLGGDLNRFPATTLGLVARFGGPGTKDGRPVLEELCRRYWKPIYHYVRVAWGKTNEDAKDVTQNFLLWLLEGDALTRFAPDRGSFRNYLKILLKSFVGHRDLAARRLKRGGGTLHIPLEEAALEEAGSVSRTVTPEQAFDEAWSVTVMKVAIDRVRERMTAEGREVRFKVFELYDLVPEGGEATYGAVAAKLGLKEAEVRDHLHAARLAVRAEIRAELGRATPDDRIMEDEWAALFGSWGGGAR